MKEESIIEIIKIAVTATGGITLFIIGRIEYRKSVKIKRAEFLDKLIAEFLDKESEIARSMLDDYVYVTAALKELSPIKQKEQAVSLGTYLRNHNIEPIGSDDEIKVRKSFDKLLDFMTKLSYYLSNKLITPSELTYFKYYLNKINSKNEVKEYIKVYFYMKDFDILVKAVR